MFGDISVMDDDEDFDESEDEISETELTKLTKSHAILTHSQAFYYLGAEK